MEELGLRSTLGKWVSQTLFHSPTRRVSDVGAGRGKREGGGAFARGWHLSGSWWSQGQSAGPASEGIYVLPSSSLHPLLLLSSLDTCRKTSSEHCIARPIYSLPVSRVGLFLLYPPCTPKCGFTRSSRVVQYRRLNSTVICNGRGKKRTSFFPPLPSLP